MDAFEFVNMVVARMDDYQPRVLTKESGLSQRAIYDMKHKRMPTIRSLQQVIEALDRLDKRVAKS